MSAAGYEIGDGGPYRVPILRTADMDLRDHFAGLAMVGLLANKGDPKDYLVQAACDSYRVADAMLAARSRAAS